MVNWLMMAIVSGIIMGFWDVCKKAAMMRESVFNVLALYTGFSALVMLVDVQNAFAIDWRILPLVLTKSVLIYFCWVLAFIAIKHLPISVAGPLRSLTPLFTVALSVGILGERLSYLQYLGVAVIFAAYLIIGYEKGGGIGGIFKNRFFYLMVVSTFLSSLSGLIDKVALRHINAGQLQFWFMWLLAILYMVTHVVVSYRKEKKVAFKFNWYILMMSILLLVADRVYFLAVAMPGSQLSVIMPLRYVSVIISVVVGGMVFGEDNLKIKFIGATQLIIGISMVFSG